MTSPSEIIASYVCPSLGVIMANLVFSAPINDLRSAKRLKTLGDLNPLPWAFMTGNCLGWVAYSYLTEDIFVFLANAPGFLISIWLNFGAAKLQYHMKTSETTTDDEDDDDDDDDGDDNDPPSIKSQIPQERALLVIISLWIVIFTIVFFLPSNISQDDATTIVGIAVNLNLVIFFAAPLSTIVTVLKYRDSSSIHFGTMATSVLNCAFWMTYGLAEGDYYIFVPNGTAFVLSVVQGVLYFGCPNRKRDAIEEELEKGSGGGGSKGENGAEEGMERPLVSSTDGTDENGVV